MNVQFRISLAMMLLLAGACHAAPPTAQADKPGDRIPAENGDILVYPIDHASFVLTWSGKTVYVDPVGGAKKYAGLPKPDAVLITHAHSDHFDVRTLEGLIAADSAAKIVAPQAVADKMPAGPLADKTKAIAAGEKAEVSGVLIEAVPANNITPERKKFHPKGEGLGYVIQLGG